jgi:hypothetical protein
MEFDLSQFELSKKEDYIKITREDIPKNFEIINNMIYLKNSSAKPFTIDFPLVLNKELAKISAMILDGSISKNLASCGFSQKKDKNKVVEFLNIIKLLFDIDGRFSIRKDNGAHIVEYSRKTFVSFLYYCLDIHKSDESARIPRWIWDSPRNVIREYLRYAFAMEGSVSHYLKATEIKFHSVDLPYLIELKKLLREKFDINSRIYKYYIQNYGWKYNLFFADQKTIKKFYQIGFALKSHQKRLTEIISNFKNKAWEITLVTLLSFNKKSFTIFDVKNKFQYLCRRAIHQRITDLIDMEYVEMRNNIYSITIEGYKIASILKNKVKVTKLRTNPKINEESVIQFLKLRDKSYRNEIARELKINPLTVRDTLKRLIKKGKIQFVSTDKFQRRFYRVLT